MKFNKWTLGLAALGVVSLASATAKADTAPAPNYVESASKGISISGFVDTSVNYQAVTTAANQPPDSPLDNIPFQAGKRDGFNLDVIELNAEHDVDATPWSSGFKFSLLAGPDAVNYNTSANAKTSVSGSAGTNSVSASGGTLADFCVKQAYVELMAPLGNGLDTKIGVFDTIIGYEVFENANNPNYTRSYGYGFEPTENEGVLFTYKFSDMVSASFGVVNTLSAGIDTRDTYKGIASDWWKSLEGSVTITAPSSWGFLGGSSFYVGGVNGFNAAATSPYVAPGVSVASLGTAFLTAHHVANGGVDPLDANGTDQLNLYAGAVLNTPLKELTTGFAFDFVGNQFAQFNYFDTYNFGLYATYKATDKLSFNGRAEYGWFDNAIEGGGSLNDDWFGVTGTVEYDLWANVMSRLEVRWDQNYKYSEAGYHQSGLGLYANVIYKF